MSDRQFKVILGTMALLAFGLLLGLLGAELSDASKNRDVTAAPGGGEGLSLQPRLLLND
ncbi:hypothetical protein [Pontiella sulfatireligans]|uniref:Uncharacterized protein n=1 Tax=Pontiella sulfatireligans TaxID=2750658 RepID=A0A6C2UPB0_9BACT|nr:hypothetical protein [Pontiella sulfatireligans]VGO22105.1 hypothetical protein SCARR_04186 [Pontiella sulfatireligans]